MATPAYSTQSYNPAKKRYAGVTSSMTGVNPRFNLPQNYGFNELAGYEEGRRTNFGLDAEKTILDRRNTLASSLADSGKRTFDMAMPGIMENLNSRGVYNSSTAVAKSSADALKEIELENQGILRNYDDAALSARLQGGQDGLDSALDLRRGKLEGDIAEQTAGREEALARDLARKSSRNQLTGSLIGAGGTLLGAGLEKGGFLTSLFGKGAAAGGTGTVGAGTVGTAGTTGTAGAAGAGGIGLGGAAAIGGAGIGAALLSRAAEKKGGTAAGIVANPIGYQLNKAKELIQNPKAVAQKVSAKLGIGKKKGADGNAIADTARTLQSYEAGLDELKGLRDSGQIDDATYQQEMMPILKEYHQLVNGSVSKGSAWANAINPEWQRLQKKGFVKAANGQWVTDSGGVLWDPTRGWA